MDIPQPFLINHRFLIDLSRHTVYNLETQVVTRLELRHVNLLGQLYRNKGKLVERDFLIREIWQDYSGADEALTQGISVLRKLLADEQKELIKTIPKKGYVFLGEVSVQPPISPAGGEPLGQTGSRFWLSWIVWGMLLVAVLLILLRGIVLMKTVEPGKKENKPFQYVPAPAPLDSAADKREKTTTSPPLNGKGNRKKQGVKLVGTTAVLPTVGGYVQRQCLLSQLPDYQYSRRILAWPENDFMETVSVCSL